ncbi:glycosyltransferase family 1 protein [Halalkalibacterium halodurans]|uniref:glycosyltransferase n=1 Tax=Halalkalibacterium halodurans TaxID=86665 RepID=UPI00106772F0|nr:glycosyltransferase [Halalkalibacterium halodurans]TES46076.1 glycosyltransferase family 1 protein [Halalkalibacterium halodurans]
MSIIIFPPTIDWSWMKQRPQQLAKQFARNGHIVCYCNKTFEDKPIEEVEENLFVVFNHAKWIKSQFSEMRRRTMDKVIVWNSWPKLVDFIQQYNPDKVIYDCIDEFPQWLPYEEKMAQSADAIVCSSQRLFNRMTREHSNKRIEMARNAYDTDLGLHIQSESDHIYPIDLPKNGNGIVGYVGAWAPWIDEMLVKKMKDELEGVEIVVIGPEFGRKFSERKLEGVTYLGIKPHQELKHYIHAFSVCLIPFQMTPTTRATNPVKAYEYLSAGKPVISTNLPECRLLAPYVDVANTRKQFIKLVKKRLVHPGNAQGRIRFALENSWENRAKKLESLLNEI